MKHCFFAVDLGATSGRTILGTFTPQGLELQDVNRFPNHLIEVGGHYYWDIYELYRHILEGLKLAAHMDDVQITSIGIDTWGVDFVCVGKDGGLLRQPYSYRDPHTMGAPETFFARVPRKQVYGWTGIQVMNFNSLFQLDTLRRNKDSALEAADKILFMPDALSYLLTGEMVTEYTIATTAQLVNAETRRLEPALLKEIGLTEEHFGRFVYPGEKIGVLTKEIQTITGLGAIPVIAVAGHDTASAVAAVPALDRNFAYLSSGYESEGCTHEQYKSHFALWCMMASPLLCGNDVRSMNDSTLQVLLDRDLIAINQDVLGKQAERSIRADHYDIWVKPSADGRKAVACFNRADTPRTIELNSKTVEDLSLEQVYSLDSRSMENAANNIMVDLAPYQCKVYICGKPKK